MKTQRLVSAITIFLNAERFLRDAVESVLVQTYSNWELLLVDDGSTDASTQIAKEYERKYPDKIRYLEHVNHQNKGMSASRNLGIRSARADLIALLDSDDIWLPQKLEQRVSEIERFPDVALIFGKSEYWNSWTGRRKDLRRDFIPKFRIRSPQLYVPPGLLPLLYPLGTAGSPCPSSFVFWKERALAIGGFEEQFTGMYEDQAFLVKMYLRARIYFAEGILERYRIHDHSCVSKVTAAGQYTEFRQFFLNWLTRYFDERGVDQPDIRRALENAYFPFKHPALHRFLQITKFPLRAVRRLAAQ